MASCQWSGVGSWLMSVDERWAGSGSLAGLAQGATLVTLAVVAVVAVRQRSLICTLRQEYVAVETLREMERQSSSVDRREAKEPEALTEVKEPSLALTHETKDALGLVETRRMLSLEKVEADRVDSLVKVEAGSTAAMAEVEVKRIADLEGMADLEDDTDAARLALEVARRAKSATLDRAWQCLWKTSPINLGRFRLKLDHF